MHGGAHRRRGPAKRCMHQSLRLHGARPAAAGHHRLRFAGEDAARTRACAICPIVVFTGKDLSDEEEKQLRKMAKSIIIKGVQSPERLLDETALFLHRVITRPARRRSRRCWSGCTRPTRLWWASKVLVVDDDVRNIFALTSLLERHNMQVAQRRQRPRGD